MKLTCLIVVTWLGFSCIGCGGPVEVEQVAHESQAAVFEKLKAKGADFSLDPEGKIVAVTFDGSSIEVETLQALKEIPTLKSVGLAGSGVTDAGLSYLEGISTLEGINLEDTKVSPRAVAQLREALPDCKIAYGTDIDRGGGGEDE